MQRFMAELSTPVDKTAFERSWHSDPTRSGQTRVDFVFVGQTVSAVVHSDSSGPVVGQFPRDFLRSDTTPQPADAIFAGSKRTITQHKLLA